MWRREREEKVAQIEQERWKEIVSEWVEEEEVNYNEEYGGNGMESV